MLLPPPTERNLYVRSLSNDDGIYEYRCKRVVAVLGVAAEMIERQLFPTKAESKRTTVVTRTTITASDLSGWACLLWEVTCMTQAPKRPQVKKTSRAATTHV